MTPAYALPVLMISCPGVNCLITLGSTLIGETDDSPAVPIAPNGPCYLTITPLVQPQEGVLLPRAIRLWLEDGALTGPLPQGVEAYCAPSGLIELSVTLPLLPPAPEPSVPYGLSRVELRGERGTYVATLYRENGLRVAVEDPKSDVMIALHAPRDLTDGRLMAHPFSCTHDDLILTGQGPYGHRFLVFSAREDYAPIVDDYAQGEFRQGVLYTLESLGDLSGHQYQRIYRMENGKLQESGSYGYFSSQRRQLNGPQLCIGLCQSIKLGLVEEAMGLLTPSLREQIDGSGLASFIGDFHDIRPLYRENGSRVALTLSYPKEENCYTLNTLVFTLKNGLVDNIQEEDPDEF